MGVRARGRSEFDSFQEEREQSHGQTRHAGTGKARPQWDQDKLGKLWVSPGAQHPGTRAETELAPHILSRCLGGEQKDNSSVQRILERGRMSHSMQKAHCIRQCTHFSMEMGPTSHWRKDLVETRSVEEENKKKQRKR